MTAAKKPRATKPASEPLKPERDYPAVTRRVRNGKVSYAPYIPKGAYSHTADKLYVATKERATANVGSMMRLMLAQRGIPAREVADTMGLSMSAVRDRVQRKTPWRLEEVAGLAAVFDFTFDEVLNPRLSAAQMDRAFAQLQEAMRLLGWNVGEQLRLDVSA